MNKTRSDDDRPTNPNADDHSTRAFDPDSDSRSSQGKPPTPNSPSFFEFTADGSSRFDHESFDVFDLDNLPMEFAGYTLVSKIGEGGAGIVFLAKQISEEAEMGQYGSVALKMIRPEIVAHSRAVRRFEKESRLHSEIESPFVTKHLQFGSDRGIFYIVSEFVEGVSLDKVVGQFKALPAKRSLRVMVDLLKALSAMHMAGVIHRDVKPANVIAKFEGIHSSANDAVDEQLGEFEVAKLTDFGLARHVEQSESLAMTRQRTTLGTPLYMAPEQHYESRAVDARADIYSVGVTLYQMLAGRPPFQAEEQVELGRNASDSTTHAADNGAAGHERSDQQPGDESAGERPQPSISART